MDDAKAHTVPGFRLSTHAVEGRSVLRLEGRLTASELALLETAYLEAQRRGDAVALDLSGLRSLDPAVAHRLAELSASGVQRIGASGFIEALLREHA